jgi:hypothetical protein
MARKVITRTPVERKRLVSEIEALTAQGMPVLKACAKVGTSAANYYNWKSAQAGGRAKGVRKPAKAARGLEALTARIQRGLGADNLIVAVGKAKDVRKALHALAAITRG